jgi:hypothetical protein
MYGDALWYSYDYIVETPERHITGHGMSMCRKSGGRWRMLNMHNAEASRVEKEASERN